MQLNATDFIDADSTENPDFADLSRLAQVQRGLKLTADLSWLNQVRPQWQEAFETSDVREVLIRIMKDSLSGYLVAKVDSSLKIFVFSQGTLHSVRSNVQAEQLPSFLVSKKMLREEQKLAALQLTKSSQ